MAEDYSCRYCKHINKENWVGCKAFPRIPLNILDGSVKHSKVLPNQEGDFVYELDPKSPYAPKSAKTKTDASTPIRRRVKWNGLELGITHEPEMYRFPGRMMLHSYGHVRGTYGKARDGKSVDCYWGDCPTGGAWRITQLNPETGEEDEEKLMLGFPNGWEARQSFIYHAGAERFGGMVPMEESELGVYRRHVEEVEEEDDD